MPSTPAQAEPVGGPLSEYLADVLGDPGPFGLERLSGGNSNETLLLRSPTAARILRRPPRDAIDPSAHNMAREFQLLSALAATDVPAPAPLALIEDAALVPSPWLVMEAVPGYALAASVPPGAEFDPAAVGTAVIDALARLHSVDWQAAGLADFGRPEGFLDRQVARWSKQLSRYQVRPLEWHAELAEWLSAHQPADAAPGILHGDFHLDNCLVSLGAEARVTAIIDWEMATVGDPLFDLGLFLAFWGDERPAPPAMPSVQAVTRAAGAPPRAVLAERYAARSGRPVTDLNWYMAAALWKLATIVEGAYAQYLAGRLQTSYARDLEHDVPRLLAEAAAHAGLTDASTRTV